MKKNRRFHYFMERISIRWRLALVSLGLLIILLSGLGIILSLIAEQVLMSNEVSVLHSEAQVAFQGVTRDIHPPQQRPFILSNVFFSPTTPAATFSTTAKSLLHALASPDTNAVILSTNGTVLFTDDFSPFGSPAVNVAPNQVQQTISTTNSSFLTKDENRQGQLVIFIPLVKSFHTVGILQISTPTAPIDDFLATFHLILFLGIIGTIGLALALIFPLVAMALRPLVEIERTSREIAQGELSIRIEQPLTNDEIGRLARSFNSMIARLEAAFQKQKRFVGDVSHELRTPLTALSGSLEMLLIGADQGDPEVTRRLAHGMYAEVQRLYRMVEDLLVLTRLDEGKLRLRQSDVLIDELFQTVCGQADHLAHGQELRCVTGPELPMIHIDRDLFQQILLNLVDNALKFTPPEGLIELRAEQTSQNTVLLTVRDTGQGISPEALPHVFDRFYRADPARSRSRTHIGGSGLGLAIAKELVETQGGTIEISSELGQGTSVMIRFPAHIQKKDGLIAVSRTAEVD